LKPKEKLSLSRRKNNTRGAEGINHIDIELVHREGVLKKAIADYYYNFKK
jgi:hypothetical protein